jgi:hypothetical protein
MQRHLRCHGLPGEEVERLAGNILAITRHLRMARRTIYHHHSAGGQVGAGPQTFVDGAPVPGYASYDCLGMCGPTCTQGGRSGSGVSNTAEQG